MYLIIVLLLMAVFPICSIGAEHVYHPVPLMPLVGKWFVFWGAGVRFSLAGLRQILQPRFTAEKIFHIKSDDVLPFVRELGVANLSIGIVGVASLFRPDFVLPIAIIATMFYGVAGLRHATDRVRGKNQNIAMVSDILVSLIYLAYLVFVLLGRRE
jgi:hypothetical protein